MIDYSTSYIFNFDDFMKYYNGSMFILSKIHGEFVYYVGYDVLEGAYVGKVDIVRALKPEIRKNFKHYYVILRTVHNHRKKISDVYMIDFERCLIYLLSVLNMKSVHECHLKAEIELFTGDYIRKDVDIDFVYNMLYYKTNNGIFIESKKKESEKDDKFKKESEKDDKFKKFTDYNEGSFEWCPEYVEHVERYWRKQLDDP